MLESMYAGKETGYYKLARREIASMLPQRLGRVLEIGAGTGATLTWLKRHQHADWVGGIELMSEMAKQASDDVDAMWIGDIEVMSDLPVPTRSVDCILCLDVLEHLRDPWSVLRRLADLLVAKGALIASIPNVQCI